MGFLEQVRRHWIAILLLIALLWVAGGILGGGNLLSKTISSQSAEMIGDASSARGGYYYPGYPVQDGFAPEEEERKIEKSAAITTEIERGGYAAAEQRMQGVVGSADGLLLNQNVRKYSGDSRIGTYDIKVPAGNYETATEQLQEIGELESFSESARDVTGNYLRIEDEVASERARLARYKALYDREGSLEERLQLEDRIFDQERRVKALENRLEGMSDRVEYSSISFTIREERSGYEKIGFVRLGDLVRSFVTSTKGVLYTIAYLLPWAILIGVIALVVRFFRRKD